MWKSLQQGFLTAAAGTMNKPGGKDNK